jgi:heme/copper-type cytochrome/quinol oxidase subunit 2
MNNKVKAVDKIAFDDWLAKKIEKKKKKTSDAGRAGVETADVAASAPGAR